MSMPRHSLLPANVSDHVEELGCRPLREGIGRRGLRNNHVFSQPGILVEEAPDQLEIVTWRVHEHVLSGSFPQEVPEVLATEQTSVRLWVVVEEL